MRRRKIRFNVIFILPAVLFTLGAFSYLLSYAFFMSFREFRPLIGVNRFVGLQHYIDILQNPAFLNAILRNTIYTAIVVGATFVLGMAIALLLNRLLRGSNILTVIATMPMFLIPVAAAIIWIILYDYHFGLTNHVLEFLGVQRISILSSASYAFYGVILTDIWSWTPFMFLILLAGLSNLPPEPFEAARLDGASPWQSLWYLTLPLMKPVISVALLIKAADTFRTFTYIWVMTEGGPGDSSQIISTVTYRTIFSNFRFGKGSAMAAIALVFSMMLFLIFSRFLRRER